MTHGPSYMLVVHTVLSTGLNAVYALSKCLLSVRALAGIDQTRGWFYTLMVLATALFDKPAFQNLVCNGLVLAADGKKMSKRLKNYPVCCFW